MILFFDIRMCVAFRSVEKIIIVLLKTILMIMMAMIIIFKKGMYIKYSKLDFGLQPAVSIKFERRKQAEAK